MDIILQEVTFEDFYVTLLNVQRAILRGAWILKCQVPESIEDHGEEDELAQERHHEGGGGDDLRQQQEEHRVGQEDGDGEAHLDTECYCQH